MPDLSVKTIAEVPVSGVFQGAEGSLWRKVSEHEAEPMKAQAFPVNPSTLVLHLVSHEDARSLEEKLQRVRMAIHHAEQAGNGNISSSVLREAIGFYD